MPDILIQLRINTPASRIFHSFSDPDGLSAWWTQHALANPKVGGIYDFFFGPDYEWKGEVTLLREDEAIEWRMIKASPDWVGTKVGVSLKSGADHTLVDFYHTGWKEASDHFRISSYCWAIYLRCLKANVEKGIVTHYEDRLMV